MLVLITPRSVAGGGCYKYRCIAVALIVVNGVAAGAATATAVTRWTGGGARTTAPVTITKIADDRTPGSGGQTAASATTATAAATTAGPVVHAPAPTKAAATVWSAVAIGRATGRDTLRLAGFPAPAAL